MAEEDQIPPLPDGAASAEAEAAFGPLKVTPEQGIATMTLHIAELTHEISQWQQTAEDYPARADEIMPLIRQSQKALRHARQRLAEYRMMLTAKN